jgi:N-carbamoyl-L-amino-acid hydrolase
VNGLADLLSDLSPLGRDPATGGYHRSAWTAADAAARGWFRAAAAARDLRVTTDRNGNLWAWWGDPGPGAVATGSHLDSVPDGGALDGPLGVAAAFAALDELGRRRVHPRRALAVVAFADEEGARFGVPCVGSRLSTGALAPAAAAGLVDAGGVTLAAAVGDAGVDPTGLGADPMLATLSCFVECHLEQGRALGPLGAAVGVASAIHPHGRWRLELAGEANHAGTTLLADRRDPTLPLAAAVLAARDCAAAAGGGAVATVGRAALEPGATNAVAGRARGWLDVRAPTEDAVRTILDGVLATTRERADAEGVTLAVTEESWTARTAFDAALADRISAVLGDPPRLPTGAGHDAGVLAAVCPTAMIFVRNPTGVSHSPAETTSLDDCLAGAAALAAALTELLET